MQTAALIVAAGRGTRFGGDIPKQYVPLAGPCAFRRSIEQFLDLSEIAFVQPVIHAEDEALFAQAVMGLDDTRICPAVTGGDTRAASVLRGLLALEVRRPDCVLIHDAARPFVSARVITEVVKSLAHCPAAFAALPVVDALWEVAQDEAQAPVPRDGLWRAQTPQGFHYDALLAAHQAHSGDAADDVEIARAAGIKVKVVQGEENNFKITSPDDLARALSLLG
ncbi:MAG: 2-C-methyl-D-erythritol 4-phosphate cytidylyltransferase [Sulfitobacter sp.]